MEKYSQIKRYHHNCKLQVYIYTFGYVYPDTIVEGGYNLETTTFVENYKKNKLLEACLGGDTSGYINLPGTSGHYEPQYS